MRIDPPDIRIERPSGPLFPRFRRLAEEHHLGLRHFPLCGHETIGGIQQRHSETGRLRFLVHDVDGVQPPWHVVFLRRADPVVAAEDVLAAIAVDIGEEQAGLLRRSVERIDVLHGFRRIEAHLHEALHHEDAFVPEQRCTAAVVHLDLGIENAAGPTRGLQSHQGSEATPFHEHKILHSLAIAVHQAAALAKRSLRRALQTTAFAGPSGAADRPR